PATGARAPSRPPCSPCWAPPAPRLVSLSSSPRPPATPSSRPLPTLVGHGQTVSGPQDAGKPPAAGPSAPAQQPRQRLVRLRQVAPVVRAGGGHDLGRARPRPERRHRVRALLR